MEDLLHQLPFLRARGIGGTALELGYIRFPVRLARQGGEPLPLAEMKKERAALIAKNKSDYASLKNERTEFLKLQKIKANLESALRSEPERSREPDR